MNQSGKSERLVPNHLILTRKVLLDIHPESEGHIDDQWRSECDKTGINKEEAYLGSANADPVTNILTYAKC